MLLNLKGGDWKAVRSSVTPAFSSSRLRYLLNLIDECGQQMVQYLRQFDNTEIEMKDVMGRFTLEVIGACAFGIKSDSLCEQNAKFLQVAENYDHMPFLKKLRVLFVLLFVPEFSKQFNISFLDEHNIAALIEMLQEAKSQRRSNTSNNKHGDFLQLILDAAEKELAEKGTQTCLDDDTIDGQSILFLLAGFETSSSLLSCSVLVLAYMEEVQDKLRAHIFEVTRDKEMTYDVLSQLDYLEGFLLETLRRYPPIARIDRVCVKPYVLPGTQVKINVGDVIAVPVTGIQMDAKYFEEPEDIKPDRFMRDGKVIKPSHTFLAFGSGPRNCIGMRFAMFSAKCAMVHLLKNFKFSVCSRTAYPIEYETNSVFLKAKAGLWVKIEKLQPNV
ncbi:cytochrome P450 9e2-like [Leptidea sinapis]|uniref:cytochrome P450 9e2-like n=1 Tax=Leptidea sinapis TaxID=189913 RepID=UPI0021C3B34B|nr:cytochrome P450 9e2-like [Leptidea sinapis]